MTDLDKRRKSHRKAAAKYRQSHPELYRQLRRNDMYEFNARYSYLRHVAKLRKLPMSISKDQHKHLLSQPCYYCGNSLLNETGVGLDRIDNRKTVGYAIENVLPCCGSCNRIRNAYLTVDEMKFVMTKLAEYRQKQKEKNCAPVCG